MKTVLLLCLALAAGLAVSAQKPQVKKGVYTRNCQTTTKIVHEPVAVKSASAFTVHSSGLNKAGHPDIVSVLDLGTSTNVLGYSGGTRTMVWANDDLNCVINFHRMGPGSTPPSLSGYLGMDIGLNMGKTQSDWTSQVQVHAATLVSSPYYYDASRYPSAAIYNPAGNTTLANAYLAYFAPNFANLAVSGFGGYSYGTANLADHADTTKHLRWYSPPPYTYVPDGFTISKTGIAHMVDRYINAEDGTEVYLDSVIYGRGVWNDGTKDFDYTFRTIAFPCEGSARASDCKIAASPDGNTVWMSVLTNYPGAPTLIDSTYIPVLRKSVDGGLTWGDPIFIILDGPNGLSEIKNTYSDYFIQNFFTGPPFPSRDEIPYTTAFDHSLSVDKWGNAHIGVAVGYAPGGYSISTGVDSLINVFDIALCRTGINPLAVFMGSLSTFRGTWATNSSDNRVYISTNKTGDKMFFTWNDTHIDGEVNNQNPDIFARGFNLLTNKITSDNGLNAPNNVTFLCDITQEAYWQCTAPFVFTDDNKYTLPICTQWFADAAADASFKYIPDFSYVDADFTIPVFFPMCPVGQDEVKNEYCPVTLYPNPVDDVVNIAVTLEQPANVTIGIANIAGQQVLWLDKGIMSTGQNVVRMDAGRILPGVYFVTVGIGGEIYKQKMIVE